MSIKPINYWLVASWYYKKATNYTQLSRQIEPLFRFLTQPRLVAKRRVPRDATDDICGT